MVEVFKTPARHPYLCNCWLCRHPPQRGGLERDPRAEAKAGRAAYREAEVAKAAAKLTIAEWMRNHRDLYVEPVFGVAEVSKAIPAELYDAMSWDALRGFVNKTLREMGFHNVGKRWSEQPLPPAVTREIGRVRKCIVCGEPVKSKNSVLCCAEACRLARRKDNRLRREGTGKGLGSGAPLQPLPPEVAQAGPLPQPATAGATGAA